MVFAYSELTQKVIVSKMGFVGDEVNVGLSVDVRVVVGVRVAVVLAVELAVGVSGSGVKVTSGVVGGRIEGVGVGVTGGVGVRKKFNASASRITIPTIMGMAY